MTVFDTDLLSDLIDQKRGCLRQLHKIGAKQLELIRGGSMADLLELLATKQHVLAQLQQIQGQLERFRVDDPEKRRWQTPEKRQACAARAAECEALLIQVMMQEKQSEQELTRRRDEAAAQLEGLHAASQARGAYLAAHPTPLGQLNLVSNG